MPRIMFVWEQGGGFGHIIPYVSSIKKLQAKGHEVFFVIKDLSRAPLISRVFRAPCFQAPVRTWPSPNQIKTTFTYAQVLHNLGFNSLDTLIALMSGWHVLYATIKPHLAIFEHSPIALLAARAHSFSRTITGTGFVIPPPIYPLPNLQPWLEADPERLRNHEDRIVANTNRLLERMHLPGLKHIIDLFAGERTALKTFKELDHYPERKDGNYFGTWISSIGDKPDWPEGPGKKVFVYLKPSPALPSLLSSLIDLRVPTIAYIERFGPRLHQKFNSASLRFVYALQDMNRVAKECDVAVLNGTHNASANLLLAGKPTLHLPLNLEQIITARNIERLGGGIRCANPKAEDIREKLEILLTSESINEGARGFAARHASMNAEEQSERLVSFIEDGLA